MMRKKKVKDSFMGGLLFLCLLLILHALCNGFNSGKDVIISNNLKGIDNDCHVFTAHQKITLGIPLSVNRECTEDLVAVPGIGPCIAGLIVQERLKKGDFKRLDEIMHVRGIGPGLYERLKSYLVL